MVTVQKLLILHIVYLYARPIKVARLSFFKQSFLLFHQVYDITIKLKFWKLLSNF